jgi:hypothetical protein
MASKWSFGQLIVFHGCPLRGVGIQKERDRLASLWRFWPLYDVFVTSCKKHHNFTKWPGYGVFCIVGESLPSIFPISIPFRVG